MIELRVVSFGLGSVSGVEYRWRGMDADHNVIERRFHTFVETWKLPEHVTQMHKWYEDRGAR